MFLQSYLQEKWSFESWQRKVPALGPVSARPLTPEFKILDESGNLIDLKKLQGKVVYLNFWAQWCSPCMKEMPFINKLQAKFSEQGFQSILINMDLNDNDIEKAKKIKASLAPLPFGTFFSAKEFQQKFLVEALPFHILIDRNHRTATSFYAPLHKYKEDFEEILQVLLTE